MLNNYTKLSELTELLYLFKEKANQKPYPVFCITLDNGTDRYFSRIYDEISTKLTRGTNRDWKFHISIHPEDMERAWQIIAPLLLDQEVFHEFKVILKKKLAEKVKNSRGKEVVLYTTGWQKEDCEGYLKLIAAIEAALVENNIRPDENPLGARKVTGATYTYYRNDKNNEGKYVVAVSIKNLSPEEAYNSSGSEDSIEKFKLTLPEKKCPTENKESPKTEVADSNLGYTVCTPDKIRRSMSVMKEELKNALWSYLASTGVKKNTLNLSHTRKENPLVESFLLMKDLADNIVANPTEKEFQQAIGEIKQILEIKSFNTKPSNPNELTKVFANIEEQFKNSYAKIIIDNKPRRPLSEKIKTQLQIHVGQLLAEQANFLSPTPLMEHTKPVILLEQLIEKISSSEEKELLAVITEAQQNKILSSHTLEIFNYIQTYLKVELQLEKANKEEISIELVPGK